MKLVTAVVKPFKLDEVKVALQGVGGGGVPGNPPPPGPGIRANWWSHRDLPG
jgi:hypothetical protein